jgi:NAD(P)-dependent dehydrogenase (short-subunit alcohol dehydrogenase family)
MLSNGPAGPRSSIRRLPIDPSDILLEDQVAFITGGGAGIGAGIAVSLARFGASVVLADVDRERADATAAKIEALGRRVLVCETDVRETDQIRAAVEAAKHDFGRIDILVNNAGGVRGRPFLEQSERSWRNHIDINLVSTFAATSAIAPIMIDAGRGGSIVNIASIEATRAAPNYAVYAACKAGMASFTRSMAVELSEHRIRVNCLMPDMIATPGNHGRMTGPVPDPLPERPEEIRSALDRYIPLGHEGSVEEFAGAAVFLCSKMGSYITGAMLPVDGGTWAASGWVRSSDGRGFNLFEPWISGP